MFNLKKDYDDEKAFYTYFLRWVKLHGKERASRFETVLHLQVLGAVFLPTDRHAQACERSLLLSAQDAASGCHHQVGPASRHLGKIGSVVGCKLSLLCVHSGLD